MQLDILAFKEAYQPKKQEVVITYLYMIQLLNLGAYFYITHCNKSEIKKERQKGITKTKKYLNISPP